jgi:hypothetical protein
MEEIIHGLQYNVKHTDTAYEQTQIYRKSSNSKAHKLRTGIENRITIGASSQQRPNGYKYIKYIECGK